MDFVEGLPKSQWKDSIMVVVDKLSKYKHFVALSHPYNAKHVKQKLMARDKALVALKEHLTRAQNRMKKFHDLKRREVEFEVGTEGFLKLKPYRQQTLAKKRCEKLSPKFADPIW